MIRSEVVPENRQTNHGNDRERTIELNDYKRGKIEKTVQIIDTAISPKENQNTELLMNI